MSLKKIADIRRTLAFRLTLWYTMIFIISSLAVFIISYSFISADLQIRADQELVSEIDEFSSISKQKGIEGIKALVIAEAESEGIDKAFYRIADLKGKTLLSSNMSPWHHVGIGRNPLSQLTNGADHVFETLSIPGRRYDVRIVYGRMGPDYILQVGKSLEGDVQFLKLLRRIFSVLVGPLVLFSAFVGWLMARRALGGVEKVTETALEISKGAFEKRVVVRGWGHEIERLGTVFNIMLDRIHTLIKSLREVTDNIAHDMKTPITRIRTMAESHLAGDPSGNGLVDLAADTVEECDTLLQMINIMLDISETEAGVIELKKTEINMTEVIQKAIELFRLSAAEKGVHVVSEVPESAVVSGDLHSLQRMIVNLLENAVKYTQSGGTVTVSINSREKDHMVITVKDTGIGISDEDLPHIFERLYRCDTSRSEPGFGLGLSLAMAIARAHGGNITASSRPGKGSLFTVTLPQ